MGWIASNVVRYCAMIQCMRIVEAEFNNGMLRPVQPLPLRPGEHVGIVLVRRPDPSRWDMRRLSKAFNSEEDRQLSEEGLGYWTDALSCEDQE